MVTQGHGKRGQSLIEATLLIPWLVFLFVGALDLGFYYYALISLQSAARVAAVYTSSSTTAASDSTTACFYVLEELRAAPNIGPGVTACSGSTPVQVTAQASADAGGGTGALMSTVTVTYRFLSMVPIPGLLPYQLTMTRVVRMRVRGT